MTLKARSLMAIYLPYEAKMLVLDGRLNVAGNRTDERACSPSGLPRAQNNPQQLTKRPQRLSETSPTNCSTRATFQ
jgi:hypothetical protein